MKHHTYELVDSRTDEVFYVGKGSGQRRFAHERDAIADRPGPKCDRIREILGDGGRVVARIVNSFAGENDAYADEIRLIAHYGAENLTNISTGGHGCRRKADPVEDARKVVRACHMHIRNAILCFRSGVRVSFDGLDLVALANEIAERTREKAGAEYFDRLVWAEK